MVKEKAEEEVGYSVTVKALSESGSGNYGGSGERSEVWKRERHVEPVHSKTVLEQTLPLASSE